MDNLQKGFPEILREILSYITFLGPSALVNHQWHTIVKGIRDNTFYLRGGYYVARDCLLTHEEQYKTWRYLIKYEKIDIIKRLMRSDKYKTERIISLWTKRAIKMGLTSFLKKMWDCMRRYTSIDRHGYATIMTCKEPEILDELKFYSFHPPYPNIWLQEYYHYIKKEYHKIEYPYLDNADVYKSQMSEFVEIDLSVAIKEHEFETARYICSLNKDVKIGYVDERIEKKFLQHLGDYISITPELIHHCMRKFKLESLIYLHKCGKLVPIETEVTYSKNPCFRYLKAHGYILGQKGEINYRIVHLD